jgi:hypothetical protein
MNGRLSKEARALEVARFAICDFQERVGEVMLVLEKVREAGLAESHHIALDAWLTTTDHALDDWQEAEVRSAITKRHRSASFLKIRVARDHSSSEIFADGGMARFEGSAEITA